MSKKKYKAKLLIIKKLCLYIIYLAHRSFRFNIIEIKSMFAKENNQFDDC